MARLQTDLTNRATQIIEASQSRRATLAPGRLPTHQALARLIDPGSAFLEIGQFAGLDCDDGCPPGAGLITGIGRISGRLTMVMSHEAPAQTGLVHPPTIERQLRAQQIAADNHLPCLYLIDSAGLSLPQQDQLFAGAMHFGRIAANQARMSARGIPQIAALLGRAGGDVALLVAGADEIIISRHSQPLSVVADHLAMDDAHALALVRRAVARLPAQRRPVVQDPAPPLASAGELAALVPADPAQSANMRQIIACLVDGSKLDEYRRTTAPGLITGFAHIHGMAVAIVANHHDIDATGADKAAQFIHLAEDRHMPLLFLHNCSTSAQGDPVHLAPILRAAATISVPCITLLIGGSFGAQSHAMAGRGLGPHFLWSWPNARLSLMAPDAAADHVARTRPGHFASVRAEEAFKAPIRVRIERQAQPLYAAARLWTDGVIAPQDSRQVLALSLTIALSRPEGDQ